MNMTEEQFELLAAFIQAKALEANSNDDFGSLRIERKLRNAFGLHQHSDNTGPWKAED